MTVYRINITWFYCYYHYLHLIIILAFVSPSISIISSFSRWTILPYATFKISKNGQFYDGHFIEKTAVFSLWYGRFSMKNGHFSSNSSPFPCSRSKYSIIFELRYVIIICLPSFKPSKPLPKSPICPHLVSFIQTIWKWGPPRSPTSLAPLHIPDSGRSDGGLRGALRRELEAKTKLLRTHVK